MFQFHLVRRCIVSGASYATALTLVGVALTAAAASTARHERAQTAGPSVHQPLPPLPVVADPVDTADVIKATYEFAARHPEVLRYMPCYCACGRTVGHRSNEDCFIAARGKGGTVVWNDHAAECHICLAVAKHARDMHLKGADVSTIRAEVDRVYGEKYKNRTSTPQPPKTGSHMR